MNNGQPAQESAPTFGRFLAETAIYLAIFWALFLLFDSATVILIAVCGLLAAIAAQVIWSFWRQPRPKEGDRLSHVLAGIHAGAGGATGVLATSIAVALWLNFGLDLERNPAWMSNAELAGANNSLVFVITLMAVITLLAYFLPLVGLRRRGIVSGSFASFVRADLTGFFHSPMIQGTAALMALVGLLSSLTTLPAMESLVAALFPGKDTGLMHVAALYPILPLGLLASCMLMSIARPGLGRDPERVNALGSHFEHGAPGRRRRPNWQGLVTVSASVVIIGSVVYTLHFGLVAALGVVTGISPSTSISEAVHDWEKAQDGNGRSGEDIAADLNRHGKWSAAAPGEGLAALLPGLDEALADTKCVAEIAAAPLDPAVLAGVDWIGEDHTGRTLRYCLRIACPNPAAWGPPALVILTSSHPSHNDMWVGSMYMDVFAYGAAPEPGGFCAPDGKLTEAFQG